MAILIPADFFDGPDPGALVAPLLNPLELMEQVPKKLPCSTVLKSGPDPCPKNTGLYMYNPATGKSMTLPCKSRSCPACGKGWARNWQNRIGWNEFFHFEDDKALTLTSACDPGYVKFWLALKMFWRNLRNYCHIRPEFLDKETGEYRPKLYLKIGPSGLKRWLPLKTKKLVAGGETFRIVRPFRKIEYFGIVEYNQKHTQPHFHFVLRSGYIPQTIIKKCWIKAQNSAGFYKTAFDVRIEKIQSGVKQYFFKYITKLIEGKDELPRPEQWHGRGVRYSKKFFAAPARLVKSALSLENQAKNDDYSQFYALHSRTRPILEQKLDKDQFYSGQLEATAGDWNPDLDLERAGIPRLFPQLKTFTPYNPSAPPAINPQSVHLNPAGFSFETMDCPDTCALVLALSKFVRWNKAR
jgi:hypothetical protein